MKKIMLLLLISMSSQAGIRLIGGPTPLYESLIKEQSKEINNGDIYYINLASMSLIEAKESRKLFKENSTTVIDMTEVYSEVERINFSSKIVGLGVDSPVIVWGEFEGEKAINVVSANIKDVNGNDVHNEGVMLESLTSSLIHVLDRFNGDK
ncbi:hypothetical protein F0250_04320 [Vibrio cyclitrophicus]|uniref:hypothetical protein n=1 Tax=Vibrio cyclitrophicus TaxID=47951 RepID=UPI00148E6E31|nr:hypothetical protein [Vibrio cyclitrophicus]NOI33204.1 hypothetical protein [Vibrio cyclitrophicus]